MVPEVSDFVVVSCLLIAGEWAADKVSLSCGAGSSWSKLLSTDFLPLAIWKEKTRNQSNLYASVVLFY